MQITKLAVCSRIAVYCTCQVSANFRDLAPLLATPVHVEKKSKQTFLSINQRLKAVSSIFPQPQKMGTNGWCRNSYSEFIFLKNHVHLEFIYLTHSIEHLHSTFFCGKYIANPPQFKNHEIRHCALTKPFSGIDLHLCSLETENANSHSFVAEAHSHKCREIKITVQSYFHPISISVFLSLHAIAY